MNPEVQKQVDVANEIFALAKQNGVKEIILAGGAPRDWYFDRPATDLDFYFSNITDDFRKATFTEYVSAFKDSNSSIDRGISIDTECYSMNPYITEVIDLDYDGLKCQIIEYMNDIDKVAKDFVYSICQITYDPLNGLVPLTAFQASVKHSIIIKTGKHYSNYRKYSAKIKRKFKDFKFVDKKKAFDIMMGI